MQPSKKSATRIVASSVMSTTHSSPSTWNQRAPACWAYAAKGEASATGNTSRKFRLPVFRTLSASTFHSSHVVGGSPPACSRIAVW